MTKPLRGALLLVLASLAACSFIVDFDRSKIRDSAPDGGAEDGSVGVDGDSGRDGGKADGGPTSDGATPDGQVPEGGMSGGRCTDTAECVETELCCAGVCTPALPATGCATCDGTACGDNANTCTGRACGCGTGAACATPTPFCVAIPGAADDARQCAQCRGDSDCGAGTLCVDFQCRACDHTKGNSGCSNPTPICNIDNTCVACDASHACPAPLSCTGGRCFGCDVTNNNGCDAASTTPVCDLAQGSLQCEACAADAECNGNLNGGQCTATGACHACDRAEGAINPACTDASKRYCDAATDSCRGCTDSDCTAAGKTRCAKAGASNGQCVECTESGQCSGRRPTCNTASGVCQACGNDADCTGSAGGPACGTSGGIAGRCVECTADRHCGGLTPKCNTANNSCVQCAASSDCANLNAPVCASGICVPCGLGGGNAACSAKNPAFPACRNNVTCSVCNTQNQGCGGATPICNAGGSACVGCLSATDCNDGNLCTTDSCSAANACSYAAVVPTSDNDLCTTDACVPATGATSHTAITCTAPTPACLPASGCVACDPSANVVGPPASNVNCAAGFNCSPTGTCVMAP